MTDTLPSSELDVDASEPAGTNLRRTLIAVIAVLALVVAGGVGYIWGSSGSSSSPSMPGVNSVDAGFARDMATHHQQAITMAGYTRDNDTNVLVKTIAFDIETSQSVQMGQMEGWLQQWGVSRTSGKPMSWMKGMHVHVGINGLMPGMASPAQMNKLLSSHGKALSILFLQLMIRHHQGGVLMAQYAMRHATEPYVRQLAANMYTVQNDEIVQMEQILRQLGGSPLPPPKM